MHIAFLNRSYYPDTSATGQLLTDLCEGLVRDHGCRVSVIAGMPLQPAPDHLVSVRGLVGREQHNGVEIVRARGSRFDKRRFAGRATNYVSYFLTACYAGLRIDRPDVVVALTDPPIIGLAGWLMARRARAPLVMAYQDLFPEVAALLTDFHSDTLNAALQSINQFLCQKADRIVALGETMRQRLIENKGAPSERTLIIPSWADTRAIVPGTKHNAFAAANGLTEKFVVMHSGNLGLAQSLETVVDAAARLRHVGDLQVVFVGEGVSKPDLEARARALQLTNVSFLPLQPRNRLSESFATADVFVVSLQSGLAGYIVPSKLYGILAAGRPYVAAVEPSCEVAAIAESHRCGLVAEPSSARALADAIMQFYNDRDLTRRFGENARRASAAFDRSVQVARYAELFRQLVAERPALAPLPAGHES
jgi:glycosyltransferase involved in cell wall biosynthesis